MKKKILGIGLLFAILLVSSVALITQGVSVYANHDLFETPLTINELFSNKGIDSSGYLFNYDESADYVYIDFAGSSGYAIFAQETQELLEYATVGDFPYEETNGKKYYGGPTAYFNKNGGQFTNTITNETLSISEMEAEQYAQSTRQSFSINANTDVENETQPSSEKLQCIFSSFDCNSLNAPVYPPLDEGNWISPTSGAKYISNIDYFLTSGAAPRHGYNSKGSCTTVATQLMLSYNNYYNDRRIIDDQFLFGTATTNPERNPNYCADPTKKTSYTLGSNQAFHDMLLSNKIIGFLDESQNGLKTYLDGRGVNYKVNCIDKFPKSLPTDVVVSELDAGRPLVLATEQSLNGTPYGNQREFNHSVIAYGYQSFDAYASSGDTSTYTGYIVHMGWDSTGSGSNINIWTNSAWYYSSLSLNVNHSHVYRSTGITIDGSDMELRCDCGHRTKESLFSIEDGTVTGARYPLPREINIPSTINGINITAVGSSAFANTTITSIELPSSLITIGSNAFKNCANLTTVSAMNNLEHIGVRTFAACSKLTSLPALNNLQTIEDEAFQRCRALTRIALPSCLTSVGERAFAECSELNIVVDSKNPNYCADGNILYDKNMTTIIAAGKTNSDVVIPKSVKEIYPFAFDSNSNLSTLQIQSNINIGNFAFANCSFLHSVYIDLYSSPSLGINAFYNDNFVLYVPYNEQEYFRNKFAGYTQNIDSIKITVTFVNNGAIIKQDEVYYGSTITNIIKYYVSGYIFDGWYDNETFKGSKYTRGQLWESKENITLYVRLISKAAVNNYIRQFQSVGTHYVQNAYNSSRSTGLSIVDIPKYYQSTGNIAAGFKLYNDTMAFDQLNSMVVRPLTIIVGYTKTSVFKELETINSWLDKCDNIVIMGNSLFTFLKAMGYETGLAHVEDKYIDFATEIMEKADQKGINLYFPRFVNTISSDGQNSCGLREINNIPANEIPFTTMDYNYPESLLRVGGTLVTYGYPIFYPLDKLPNGGSIQVNNLLEEKCLDFVRYNEGNIPQNTGMFFVKDWLNLKNDDRYIFYTDADDIPTLDEALYQNIMVNGNIHSISDFIYRKEDVIIMRVECNVGKMGEALSQERFKKNIAAFIPDLKYILENFECKVILIGCNRVEKDKDWNLYEYSDPNFLNTCSEMLGAQVGFIPVDVLDRIHSMRGQFYWTNNIDPYEKYYAF